MYGSEDDLAIYLHRSRVSKSDLGTTAALITVLSRAIPNGVVSAFSTVIIRDMVCNCRGLDRSKLHLLMDHQGFSTTKTTELKSVGDAVQIVALFIAGTITLNVPNCKRLPWNAIPLQC